VDRLFASPLAGATIAAANASIVLVEWTDPGGGFDPSRYIAPLHLHRDDDEAWYVLSGLLRVRVGDRDVEVPPGGGVLVPRGTPHTYWNPSPGATRYLLVMTPRIAGLIEAIHALSGRDEETLSATSPSTRASTSGGPEAAVGGCGYETRAVALRVAPIDAVTTNAAATISVTRGRCPSTMRPTAAATAGSRLVSTP